MKVRLKRISTRIRVRKKYFYGMIFFLFCITGLMYLICLFITSNSWINIAEAKNEEKTFIDETEYLDNGLNDIWLSNKEINEDYIAQIVFDSGLIDLPVVQAKDVYRKDGSLYTFYTEDGELVKDPAGFNGNDVYIWTSWKTGEYDPEGEGGSVFMDYRNEIDDQNIIIYGHHFARDYDPEGKKQFTPLDLLLKEENYEANKSLKLILEDEVREYIITNVFRISVLNDYQIQIVRTDMNKDLSGIEDPDFFEGFIDYMDEISLYDTGEKLNADYNILTLITCIQHQPELRQVIVCREMSKQIVNNKE